MPLPIWRRQPEWQAFRRLTGLGRVHYQARQWHTWTPSLQLRPSASGGARRLVRRDGATDRL